MATAPVDIPVQVKGLSDLQKLERRMEALEREVTRLQKATPKAAQATKQLGRSAKGAAVGVKALGTAIKSTLAPLAAATTAMAGLTAGFRTIAGQDFAAAKVESLGVNSVELVENLRAVSKELEGNASVAELTAAAYDVASAGFTEAADAAKVLKAASLGATGGFSDINTVGDAATSVLNAYGKSASEAGRLIDGFIQTQNDGKIVVDDYARNIGKVASAAAGLKIPIEEVNTVIAQSTASGVQAEVAFTGLKGALARLASGEASKALADFGIEINSASLEADGLLGTLDKFKDLDTGAILKALGTEAGPALLPVINNLERAQELLENQKNAAGAAQAAQERAANTINGAWNRVRVAFENLFSDQAALAQAIIPILDAVATEINDIAAAVNGWKSIIDDLVVTFNNLKASLPSGGAFDAIADGIKSVGDAAYLALNPLGAMLDMLMQIGAERNKADAQKSKDIYTVAGIKYDKNMVPINPPKTKPPTLPKFTPLLSGGGVGGGGGGGGGGSSAAADEAARRAEQMKEQLLTAEKMVVAAERELAVLQAQDQVEKAKVESTNKIFEIAEKYSDLAANVLSDAEAEALLKAQGLEVANERIALEERLADIEKQRFGGIDDEIAHMEAILAGTEKEYLLRKKIAELGGGPEAEAKVMRLDQLTQEVEAVKSLEQQYQSLATGIAGEMTGAFRSIIDGSKTAEEAMADMFQGIADKFLDMAMQILQDAIVQQLIKLIPALFGGGVPAAGPMPGAFSIGASFEGGGYTGNGPRAGGLDGKGGTLAVVHPDETIIDHRAPMGRYNGGNSPSNGGGPMQINFQTQMINSVEYVTKEQAMAMSQQAADDGAKRGAQGGHARSMQTLLNSRSQRAKLGMS